MDKDFHEVWHLGTSRKSVQKIQVSLKSDKNNGVMCMKIYARLW